MSAPYAGAVDEARVGELITEMGQMFTEAGEVGFVITYHAVNEPGTSGRMNLSGSGISHAQLVKLLCDAMQHDLDHGSTR